MSDKDPASEKLLGEEDATNPSVDNDKEDAENTENAENKSSENMADANPPSYDSLFGKYRRLHDDCPGRAEFIKGVVQSFVTSAAFLICFGLMMILPISSIVLGVIHRHHCPIDVNIPIYLIVSGTVGLVVHILELFTKIKNRDTSSSVSSPVRMLRGCLQCFLFGWFIAGNVWIYSAYKPEYVDQSSATYCHVILYLFAFWTTTAVWIALSCVCCCLCLCLCCTLMFDREM